jgi:hypothetical protein
MFTCLKARRAENWELTRGTFRLEGISFRVPGEVRLRLRFVECLVQVDYEQVLA